MVAGPRIGWDGVFGMTGGTALDCRWDRVPESRDSISPSILLPLSFASVI